MEQTLTGIPKQEDTPREIFNCAHCSHYLQPGTLACPECGTLVYSAYLRDLAIRAQAEENARTWPEARATWSRALHWLPAETKQYAAVKERIGLIDARAAAADDSRARWTRRLGPLAPAAFFLLKAKSLVFLLLKFKFILSFVAFFALYWGLFGWKFGLGFTVGILIHEMGHYTAAKLRGLKVDLPIFLPGLGAYVRWYSQGVSLEDLSGIALAGPLAGLLVAGACAGVAHAAGETRATPGLWSALAHVTAWLNIVNLIAVFGLDGAQATVALDRTQRWLVLASTFIFFGLLHEWSYLFVAAGMGWRIYKGDFPPQPSTRTLLTFVYLLFGLGIVMYLVPDPTRLRF